MAEETGIILKSFLPYKYKISVLSRSSGKINLIVGKKFTRFSPGTKVRFFITLSRSAEFANGLEILQIPIVAIKKHLYWIHHILEICYYFAPLGAPCAEIFQMVEYSLHLGRCGDGFEPYFNLVKKICLVKLFVMLGFYSQGIAFLLDLFDKTLVSLDSSNLQKVLSLHQLLSNVTKQQEKEIDKWILSCLHEHPHASQFKTLLFFDHI